ncbi:MAG: hypothetical protein RMI32_08440, partial [Candidatus Nitrosocaldus sp.]|nr:hypothetical protein [Candidatus Nitrosocaldus sp.]
MRGIYEELIERARRTYGEEVLRSRDFNNPALQRVGLELANTALAIADNYGVFIPTRRGYIAPNKIDVGALMKAFADNKGNLDPIIEEFMSAGPRFAAPSGERISREIVETALRNIIDDSRQRLLTKGLRVQEYKEGMLPPSFFTLERHDLPIPEKYRMPFIDAWKAYYDGLADYIFMRQIEARLGVEAGLFKSVDEAINVLKNIDSSMIKEEHILPIGTHFEEMKTAFIRSGPDPLALRALDVIQTASRRYLGMHPRYLWAELTRAVTSMMSGWMAGFGQVTQFMNDAALHGFINNVKALINYVADPNYRRQLSALARILGQSRAFLLEDISAAASLYDPQVLKSLAEAFPNEILLGDLAAAKGIRFTRQMVKAIGLEFMESRFLRPVSIGTFLNFLEEGLKRGGPSYAAYKKLHNMTDEQVENMVKWAKRTMAGELVFDRDAILNWNHAFKYTQFMYDPMDFPQWVASSPWLDAIFHFKKFVYLQSTRFLREIVNRAAAGDIAPLVRTLAVLSPMMFGQEIIRGIISGSGTRIYYLPVDDGRVIVRADMIHTDSKGVTDPSKQRGFIRRLNAVSPELAGYLTLLFESSALGMVGDILQAAMGQNPLEYSRIVDPIILSHAFRWANNLGDIAGDIIGGRGVEALKTTARWVLRDLGPPVMFALADRYLPGSSAIRRLVMGEVPTLLNTLIFMLPRTIGESLVELESETKQREIAREEAVEAFLRG